MDKIKRGATARLRDTTSETEKLLILRALYVLIYNDERSVIPLAIELFHLIGNILEGVPADKLDFRQFSQKSILQTIEDLR